MIHLHDDDGKTNPENPRLQKEEHTPTEHLRGLSSNISQHQSHLKQQLCPIFLQFHCLEEDVLGTDYSGSI